MLCEKCVILCFVVVYAVHCFGIIVKKIVGCSSNFVMMMLYYIDMCVFFVCSRLCCFSLLCDFVDQITWYQYIYDMHFWVYFDNVYIYIYTLCSVGSNYLSFIALNPSHTCITFLICTFAWSGPWSLTEIARNQPMITNTNKNQLEPFQTIKRTGQTCSKKLSWVKWAAWASTHVYSQNHLFYS